MSADLPHQVACFLTLLVQGLVPKMSERTRMYVEVPAFNRESSGRCKFTILVYFEGQEPWTLEKYALICSYSIEDAP